MIDSVVFQLPSDKFYLREQNRFRDSKKQQGRGFTIDTRQAREHTKSYKKKGIYCPIFELPARSQGFMESERMLEIQTSLPKLRYGTNLFDIDETDLPAIWKKLLFFLDDFGIETTKDALQKATIKRADFSKIIKLPDYLGRADEIIRTLTSFNYKPSSVFRYREYSEGDEGNVMKFWNSTQGYAIYDKFREIRRNGYTKQEAALIKQYEQGRFKRSALKFELSLQRKDSFEAVMRRKIKTNKQKNYCLADILNIELARDILLDAFETVFGGITMGLISLSQMEDNKLFVYLASSGLSQKQQETLYYWTHMTTKFGIAGVWEELKVRYSGGSVARRKREIALILEELGKISGNTPNLIDFLRAEHQKFEIIKPRPTPSSITTI